MPNQSIILEGYNMERQLDKIEIYFSDGTITTICDIEECTINGNVFDKKLDLHISGNFTMGMRRNEDDNI